MKGKFNSNQTFSIIFGLLLPIMPSMEMEIVQQQTIKGNSWQLVIYSLFYNTSKIKSKFSFISSSLLSRLMILKYKETYDLRHAISLKYFFNVCLPFFSFSAAPRNGYHECF